LTKAVQKYGNSDPTVHDHIGDLYQKTGRLKLAAAYTGSARLKSGIARLPQKSTLTIVARVQKKLDSAKVKLAKEEPQKAIAGCECGQLQRRS
jgi:hypothetical protein